MKDIKKINNLHDLNAEIARLNLRRREQEAYLADQYTLLKAKVNAPMRYFQLITSRIPGVGMIKDITTSIGKSMQRKDADWLTRVLQFGAPLVLNRTLLKNAGWLKKAMVLLASETAIGQVNQDKISGLLNKVTSFIKPKKNKKKKKLEEGTIEKIAVMEQQAAILEDERFTDKT